MHRISQKSDGAMQSLTTLRRRLNVEDGERGTGKRVNVEKSQRGKEPTWKRVNVEKSQRGKDSRPKMSFLLCRKEGPGGLPPG